MSCGHRRSEHRRPPYSAPYHRRLEKTTDKPANQLHTPLHSGQHIFREAAPEPVDRLAKLKF